MSIEELKIKKELETIKKTKEKINKYIGMLIAKKIDEDKIEDKERKDKLFKIRSSCLSCMNIALYRYNITNFKRKIKNNKATTFVVAFLYVYRPQRWTNYMTSAPRCPRRAV